MLFFLNDAKKQYIFAETCLYEVVGSLPVMPSLLPHVLWGRSQVSLFFASAVSPEWHTGEKSMHCMHWWQLLNDINNMWGSQFNKLIHYTKNVFSIIYQSLMQKIYTWVRFTLFKRSINFFKFIYRYTFWRISTSTSHLPGNYGGMSCTVWFSISLEYQP